MSHRLNICWIVSLVCLMMGSPLSAGTFLWTGGNAGNWGNPAEWTPNSNYPGSGSDDIAQFDNNSFSGGGGSITLADASGTDASFTIGAISKASSTANRNFSLNNTSGGSGKLIFSHNGGTATFSDSGNPNTFTDNINVAIQLNSNLSVTTSLANQTLRLTRTISELGGPRSLTKNGSGVLVLRAANSYSGVTTINNGKLVVDLTGTLGSGHVTIAGGTLDVQNAAGVFDDLASVSVANGALLNLITGLNDIIGSLTLGGVLQTQAGTYGRIGSSATVESALITGDGVLTIVPEPGSMIMMSVAAGLLIGRRRRVLAMSY